VTFLVNIIFNKIKIITQDGNVTERGKLSKCDDIMRLEILSGKADKKEY
jgi:hypothetical protein